MIEQKNEILVDYPCEQPNFSMKLIFNILTSQPYFVIIQHEKYLELNTTENGMNAISYK